MYDHTNISHAQGRGARAAEAKKVTIVGSLVNILLSLVKFAAGVAGGSMALIADAFHSLSDLATDLVVYVSISIAAQEADEDHPYGHGRAETIGAAATGAALVLIGFFILLNVIEKLIEGELLTPTWIAIVGAMISIVVKEALYHYTIRVGKKHDNQALIANAWHHRTDSISSVAALLGIAGAMMGFPVLDPIAAIFVVFMIGKVGGEILWGALQDLMDVALSPEQQKEIVKIINRTSGVLGFHELKTRKLGGDKFVDVHIQVQPNISVSEAHNIAETVRYNLKGKAGATDALVHIDAEEDMNYKVVRVDRREIENRIKEISLKINEITAISGLTIHYLSGNTFVEFNVDIDEDVTIGAAKSLVAGLKEKLQAEKSIHSAVIHGRLSDNLLS